MKMFGKLFKKEKKSYNNNCEFKLLIIDEESDSLAVSLGITQERVKELGNITKDAFLNHETLTDSYSDMIAECKHINEVAFCFTVFARVADMKRQQSQMLNMLGNLFDHDK